MAYLNPSKWDEDQQRQQAAAAPQQPELGSAPAAPASAAAGTAPAQSPQQSTAPNAFPGISAYLGANQGQGEKMGEQIDKNIGSELGQAQTDFAKGQSDWQSQNQGAIDAWTKSVQDTQSQNRSAYDAWHDLVDRQAMAADQVRGRVGGGWNIPDTTMQAPATWTIPSAPTVADYSPWATGLATGHAAESQLNALGSDAGRQAVLSQLAGPGEYGQGMSALDSALLGSGFGSGLSSKYAGILSALKGSQSAKPSGLDTSAYGDTTARPADLSLRGEASRIAQQTAAAQEEEDKKRAGQAPVDTPYFSG